MNRHHPYGGFEANNGMRRGGASPSGPGPDRSHRYQDRGGPPNRGRGFGRGRGGYGSFDGNMSNRGGHDQAYPQADMGPYNNYEAQGPSQDPYHQNGSYGVGTPSQQYPPGPPSAGFNQQAFGKYEGALEI